MATPYNAKKKAKPTVYGVVDMPYLDPDVYGPPVRTDPLIPPYLTLGSPDRLMQAMEPDMPVPTNLSALTNPAATKTEGVDYPPQPTYETNFPDLPAPYMPGVAPVRPGIGRRDLNTLLTAASFLPLLGGKFGSNLVPGALTAGIRGLQAGSESAYKDALSEYMAREQMARQRYEDEAARRGLTVEDMERRNRLKREQWQDEMSAAKDKRIEANQIRDDELARRKFGDALTLRVSRITDSVQQEAEWEKIRREYGDEEMARLGIGPSYDPDTGEYIPVYDVQASRAINDAIARKDKLAIARYRESNRRVIERMRQQGRMEVVKKQQEGLNWRTERIIGSRDIQKELDRATSEANNIRNNQTQLEKMQAGKAGRQGIPPDADRYMRYIQATLEKKRQFILKPGIDPLTKLPIDLKDPDDKNSQAARDVIAGYDDEVATYKNYLKAALDGTQWEFDDETSTLRRKPGAVTMNEVAPVAPAGVVAPPRLQGGGAADLPAFMNRVQGSESSGNPDLVNPVTGAHGLFQIMPSEWPEWSKEVFGKVMPKTPINQRLVAQQKMNEYYIEFGSWPLVAAAWFAGPDRARRLARGDMSVLNMRDKGPGGKPGITVREYIKRVTGIDYGPPARTAATRGTRTPYSRNTNPIAADAADMRRYKAGAFVSTDKSDSIPVNTRKVEGSVVRRGNVTKTSFNAANVPANAGGRATRPATRNVAPPKTNTRPKTGNPPPAKETLSGARARANASVGKYRNMSTAELKKALAKKFLGK